MDNVAPTSRRQSNIYITLIRCNKIHVIDNQYVLFLLQNMYKFYMPV